MSIDWASLLYDPIYDSLGVEATFTPSGAGDAVMLTVIDKTGGVEVGGAVETLTIRPAAVIRMKELVAKGYTSTDLRSGTIEFNDTEWRIENHILRPSPKGEGAGEIMLILSDA